MSLQLTAEVRNRGFDATDSGHASVIRPQGQQDQAESWRDSSSRSRSNCTDTLNAQRPLRRRSENGVSAVLVQARKEATADVHHETVRSQALARLRSAPTAFP
jgi:hypothetical protein